MEIYIIGGGAAGLAAAITSARCGANVTVLEALEKPGKKILKTGGGRCNFTNASIDYDSYYSSENDGLIKNFIYNFDFADAINFFESVGIYPLIRNGYVYPRSEEASSVVSALLNECEKLGVTIRNNTKVTSICLKEGSYKINVDNYSYLADKVIICCGGLAGVDCNLSEGDIYDLALNLGHKVNQVSPALTGIETDEFKSAAGVRTRAKISTGNFIEIGEIQITNSGISGIPIMNLSRYIDSNSDIFIDFIPEISKEELAGIKENGNSLDSLLPKKLSNILEFDNAKNYTLKSNRLKGFDSSQVTKGGVDKEVVDPNTFESKTQKGLYFAGEVLDVDGRCGGYNLHFAWGSGIIAGSNAAGSTYNHIMPSIDQLRRWENAEIGNRRTGEANG